MNSRIVILLCAAIAMGAMTIGCEPTASFDSEKKEISGGGSTSGSGKNENITGGDASASADDGSDVDVSNFEKYSANLTKGSYKFMGSASTIDGHMVLLSDDDYDWNTRKGEGNWALIEIFTETGAGITSGKYCINDTMNPGTSYLCKDNGDGTVSGPMFGMGEYAYVCPTTGYVEVSKSGDKYTFKLRYIDEPNERIFEGTFTGALGNYSSSGDEGDDGDEDIEFTKCEAEFYGAANGAGEWGIYFGDDDTDMSDLSGGYWAMIDLFCSSTKYSTTLPTGTFTVDDSEKAGTVGGIYEGSDGYYYGTMFGQDNNIIVGANSGSVKISASGDNYTIEMDFVDEEYDSSFQYTYTGKVKISDQSEGSIRKDFYWKKSATYKKDFSLPKFEVR